MYGFSSLINEGRRPGRLRVAIRTDDSSQPRNLGCRWRGSSVPQVQALKIQLGSLILEAMHLGDLDDRAKRVSNASLVGGAYQRELAHAPIPIFWIGDTASTRVLFRNAHARWPDVVNIEEPWIAGAVELGKLYGANTEGMWRATPWGLRPTRQSLGARPSSASRPTSLPPVPEVVAPFEAAYRIVWSILRSTTGGRGSRTCTSIRTRRAFCRCSIGFMANFFIGVFCEVRDIDDDLVSTLRRHHGNYLKKAGNCFAGNGDHAMRHEAFATIFAAGGLLVDWENVPWGVSDLTESLLVCEAAAIKTAKEGF
jgi:hypothetical protein